MVYYLVDFENTREHGLDGIEKLTEDDEVCIFYSKSADHLTFEGCEKLLNTKANVVMYRAEVGSPNALDFQLVTSLGYMIHKNMCENRQSKYCIVSRDHGFDCVAEFWRQTKEVDVKRVENVRGDTSIFDGMTATGFDSLQGLTDTGLAGLTDTGLADFNSEPTDFNSELTGFNTSEENKKVNAKIHTWLEGFETCRKHLSEVAYSIMISSDKQQLNSELCKRIDSSEVSKILKEIREIFTKNNRIDKTKINTHKGVRV